MFRLVLVVGLLAAPAAAQDWQALDGAAITHALTARVLGYGDGSQQDFKADGTVILGGEAVRFGRWQVQGDRACTRWPPSDDWICYSVVARGIDLRFTAGDGTEKVGRYIDLN